MYNRKGNTMNGLSGDFSKQDLLRLPRLVLTGIILPFVKGFPTCRPMKLCRNRRRCNGG